jgi:hypothetical protein
VKLHECSLETDQTYTHPQIITRPNEGWVQNKDDGIIPESLFKLYSQAGFLSADASEGFLKDPENKLFAYFGMLLRSLKALCAEERELEIEFEDALARAWNPIKKLRQEEFDKDGDSKARRALKYLCFTLTGQLDNVAELIALFFTPNITKLSLGKADFQHIVRDWLSKPLARSSSLYTPYEHYLDQLYSALHPLVLSIGADKDWFELLQLIRNKSAHMGDRMYPLIGLYSNKTEKFYHFLPRRWPVMKQTLLLKIQTGSFEPRKEQFERMLIHQDLISFVTGLRERVFTIIETTCGILCNAYRDFKTFHTNDAALEDLEKNTKELQFEYFPNE